MTKCIDCGKKESITYLGIKWSVCKDCLRIAHPTLFDEVLPLTLTKGTEEQYIKATGKLERMQGSVRFTGMRFMEKMGAWRYKGIYYYPQDEEYSLLEIIGRARSK